MGARVWGAAGKPVGQNVIQGTRDQVRELIETLAYGAGNTAGLLPVDAWRATYCDPVRIFKQHHSHSQVQEIAARLGIQGRGKTAEDGLIPEILRLAPELAPDPATELATESVTESATLSDDDGPSRFAGSGRSER